jgi:hypothetical protein
VLLAEHPAADLQDLLLDLARTVSVSPSPDEVWSGLRLVYRLVDRPR